MTIGGQCCGIYKRNAVLYCASIGALSPSVFRTAMVNTSPTRISNVTP